MLLAHPQSLVPLVPIEAPRPNLVLTVGVPKASKSLAKGELEFLIVEFSKSHHPQSAPSEYEVQLIDSNGGLHMGPTMTNRLMLGGDAMRAIVVKGGSVGRPHLELVIIHLENPRRTNSSEFLSFILGGV